MRPGKETQFTEEPSKGGDRERRESRVIRRRQQWRCPERRRKSSTAKKWKAKEKKKARQLKKRAHLVEKPQLQRLIEQGRDKVESEKAAIQKKGAPAPSAQSQPGGDRPSWFPTRKERGRKKRNRGFNSKLKEERR